MTNDGTEGEWLSFGDGTFKRCRPDGGWNVYGWLEVEERLNALEAAAARVPALEQVLRDVTTGGYYNDCTCGHCVEIRRVATAALTATETGGQAE